jgi:thioredoxin-related protein
VRGTPTLVFLDPDGRNVLQLAGYREPRALRAALDYVQSQGYRSGPFWGGN